MSTEANAVNDPKQERYILHIAHRSLWEQGKDSEAYQADTLNSEGFIHCSKANQVVAVANTLFPRREDLVLLLIHISSVMSPIKYEGVTSEVYPHIYGPLNREAVIGVYDFLPGENGEFQLPEEVIRRVGAWSVDENGPFFEGA